MARHSRCVVSKTPLELAGERSEYAIGIVVLSGRFYSNKHRTWTSQASVPSIIYLTPYGNASTVEEINFSGRLFIASNFSSCSSKLNRWTFPNLSFHKDVMFEKFGTSRMKTLQKARKYFTSVPFRRALSILMAPVIRDAISKRLERVAWPEYSKVPMKKSHLLTLRVTLALCSNSSTCLTSSMWSAAANEYDVIVVIY